jgi:hypothetical protein
MFLVGLDPWNVYNGQNPCWIYTRNKGLVRGWFTTCDGDCLSLILKLTFYHAECTPKSMSHPKRPA